MLLDNGAYKEAKNEVIGSAGRRGCGCNEGGWNSWKADRLDKNIMRCSTTQHIVAIWQR